MLVEVFQHVGPLLFALSDGVELLLYVGGKVIVEHLREVLQEEVIDHQTDVGRLQFSLVAAGGLGLGSVCYSVSLEGVYRKGSVFALLVALLHIAALLYGTDCRGIC